MIQIIYFIVIVKLNLNIHQKVVKYLFQTSGELVTDFESGANWGPVFPVLTKYKTCSNISKLS